MLSSDFNSIVLSKAIPALKKKTTGAKKPPAGPSPFFQLLLNAVHQHPQFSCVGILAVLVEAFEKAFGAFEKRFAYVYYHHFNYIFF